MDPFHELQARDLAPSRLREQMVTDGYALIRGLLPLDAVRSVLSDVAQVLSAAGWLLPNADPLERLAVPGMAYGDPDPLFKRVYQQVFSLESFHALPHHAALHSVMKALAGNRPFIHPKPIGRLIFPHCERLVTHAHQDYEFMGGDPECFTVWIPLHDCPIDIGPLGILAGSHRFGVQSHHTEGLHVPEIPDGKAVGDGWVSGRVNAGDVLIFHSMTVHAAASNISDRLRLSIDCRFQDTQRALNPSNLVFAGDSGKSWEKTYAGWVRDEHKFYWTKIPLKLRPSRDELAHLGETAGSASKRARYARTVEQLDQFARLSGAPNSSR